MKTIIAMLVVLAAASVAEAQFYPQMSQLREAPYRGTQRRSNYGVFVQRGNHGAYIPGGSRHSSFQTYRQGRSTHVLQGSRYRGTIYRR